MATLSEYTDGRDNNFNLIRFFAALLVLISHSYPLAIGDRSAEPLRQIVGITLGTVAVDVFFISSGFLVTRSLDRTRDVIGFAIARALRIYPGLLCSTLITIFVAALFLTELPLGDFFSHRETVDYFLSNLSVLRHVAFYLPGVFEATPFPRVVNGSLWTLPIELRMYVSIAMLWTAIRLIRAPKWIYAFSIFVIAIGLLALHIAEHYIEGAESGPVRMGGMFFAGAFFYIYRKRIQLSSRTAAVIALGTLASCVTPGAFFLAYTLGITYLVFAMAYLPNGRIRLFNRVGDYSYGMYVYAFPIQQIIASLVPGITPTTMMLLAFPPTLVMAIVSWHVVESRVLGLKGTLRIRADTAGSKG